MTVRTASLGMYDRPELHEANDALWSAIADQLAHAGVHGVPARLDRNRTLPEIWNDPALLLAQCCGYPLVTTWRGRLRYLATPRYRAPGCDGVNHRSRIVVRKDDPAAVLSAMRGRRAAVNEWTSNSGMNLFRAAVAPLAAGQSFFGTVIETGSHAASARLVAANDADVAAIDAVTFAHLEHYEPEVTWRLRTLGWTAPSPGLPLVTASTTSDQEVAALRAALDAVARSEALAGVRAALRIDSFERLPPSHYDVVLAVEAEAVSSGYAVLK